VRMAGVARYQRGLRRRVPLHYSAAEEEGSPSL
jgi:hypothetical protein